MYTNMARQQSRTIELMHNQQLSFEQEGGQQQYHQGLQNDSFFLLTISPASTEPPNVSSTLCTEQTSKAN